MCRASIQDARKADTVIVLQDVTIQQASRVQDQNSCNSNSYKVVWRTEKEAPGSAFERREKLTEGVKCEFSDGLIVFKVEEIRPPKVHRIKVHENAGECQDYAVCVGGVEVVEG